MRYLFCLLAGLLAGALLAATAASTLQRRNAAPRALMTLMQHDLATAREATRMPTCAVEGARARLRFLAGDLERSVLAPGIHDRVFVQYAHDLRAALARWDTGAACTTQAAVLLDVGHACEACHRDYR